MDTQSLICLNNLLYNIEQKRSAASNAEVTNIDGSITKATNATPTFLVLLQGNVSYEVFQDAIFKACAYCEDSWQLGTLRREPNKYPAFAAIYDDFMEFLDNPDSLEKNSNSVLAIMYGVTKILGGSVTTCCSDIPVYGLNPVAVNDNDYVNVEKFDPPSAPERTPVKSTRNIKMFAWGAFAGASLVFGTIAIIKYYRRNKR